MCTGEKVLGCLLSLDRDEKMIKWRAESFGGIAKTKTASAPPPPARQQR
jgi:hypothetical protein